MRALCIDTVASLDVARDARDNDRVTVLTARLKHRGLLMHALKYGLWALRPGGELIVEDNGQHGFETKPFSVSFETVRGWTFQCLGDDAVSTRVDLKKRVLAFRRTLPNEPTSWSAGVVFSGDDAEIPQLLTCVAALARQPELRAEAGGEIVVCGPPRETTFLQNLPAVRYLDYPLDAPPRVLIGAKKNFLIRALRNPKILVLHSRIVLDDDCLANMPAVFDLLAPNVEVRGVRGREPYLSLGVTDARSCGWQPRHVTRTVRQVGPDRYLSLFDKGLPYVDGGAFAVRRTVFDHCPLDHRLAWGEAEDVEWCRRVLAAGFLIDLARNAKALSATNKLPHQAAMSRVPRGLVAPVRTVAQAAQWAGGAVQDRVERIVGLR